MQLLYERVQFLPSRDYVTHKSHVEYMEYYQNNLALVSIGRFTAKLYVGGDCWFRYGNRVVHAMHGKPSLTPDIIEAVRRQDAGIVYTRKNHFYIVIKDGNKKIDKIELPHFFLPTPLEMKHLLLQGLRERILHHRAFTKPSAEERGLLEQIEPERLVAIPVRDAVTTDDIAHELDGWMASQAGLENVLAYYGTEGIEDDYGSHWFGVEFETETGKYPLIKEAFMEALRPFEL